MPRFVALLRGINVGVHHRVSMEELRRIFASLGLNGVETFIASGNVVFDPGGEPQCRLEERIEAGLKEALGYPVAVFIRSVDEIAAIAARRPFPGGEGSLHIIFLKAPPDAAAGERLTAFRTDADDFRINGREIYWLHRPGPQGSVISGAALEKAIGGPSTARNSTTVTRLAAKYLSGRG